MDSVAAVVAMDMSPERREQALADFTLLVALDHRSLRDGHVVDPHAEGLLAAVQAWQATGRPQFDTAGLVFAA
jgi:hypothetical protein